MNNGASAVDRHAGQLAVDTHDAVGRLMLAGSDTSDTPGMLFLSNSTHPEHTEAVVFWPAGAPVLADVVTTFERFGLRVIDREVLELPLGVREDAALQKFIFEAPLDVRAASLANVSGAITAQAAQGFEVDEYARLIVSAGLTWQQVVLVQAATRFARQAGLGLSESYVVDTLALKPSFVSALVHYFEAKFDPTVEDRSHLMAASAGAVQEQLDTATTVDEDRILRSLHSFVEACLRTNWYQQNPDSSSKTYASFKLASSELFLTGPVTPYREIFVYSNDVEGVHLRVGAVARGGIRFSDRPEDYRTEALGLTKTQNVKNSPIVPVGAKGAFVRKRTTVSPSEAYSTFINGLLDVTDNIVSGQTVAPARTIDYDIPDTYLVVAADKGTASFSDTANAIAVRRGFWLGDAFASGGSTGYDHKAMGITAKGAWVSVRRHFEHMGVDVDNQAFTVAGIGDMSGDVFGNGMLLSPHIKLVAAFDHRHIFLDPTPDTATSFAERSRLFETLGSTWASYDERLLSPGGGVWSRTTKLIALPDRAREMLGVVKAVVTPNELIEAILSAPVDLLWNGGIGTYVKARSEAHLDAADPVNDAVRIDADQLRCRVIGEGGNLGLTQRARIDFALSGGRLNADFIDNAAGVATSDIEVNLKIALDGAVASGQMDEVSRNTLLKDALGEVTHTVLANSENQTLAISLAESQAPQLLSRHERLIDNLEHDNGINRTTEVLPTKKELVARTEAGVGLTRPEIAVLLAQSKNVVQQDLLASTVPDEPAFASSLSAYFPSQICAVLGPAVREHRLAREIVATRLADDLINHVGPGLIYQLDERLAVKTPEVARAYAVVREVFDVETLWEQARAVAQEDERWQRLRAVQQFIERASSWILRRRPTPLDVTAEVDRYRDGVRELSSHALLEHADGDVDLSLLSESLEMIEISAETSYRSTVVADLHAYTNDVLSLSWVTYQLDNLATASWWDSMAVAKLHDDLAESHHDLVRAILQHDASEEVLTADRAKKWRLVRAASIGRFSRILAELRRDGVVDIPRACTVNAELELLVRVTRSTTLPAPAQS